MNRTRPGKLTAADLEEDVDAGDASPPRSSPGPLPGLPSCCVGWLCADATRSRLLVDHLGSHAGPQEARTAIKLDREAIARAVELRQGVLLQFEGGRFDRPIIVGLVEPQPSLVDELLGAPPAATASAPSSAPATAPSTPVAPTSRPAEARLDGKRVVLEGAEEVVLKCGEASITLKKDGKVILKGAYIETRSKGLNRIKGASVKIN